LNVQLSLVGLEVGFPGFVWLLKLQTQCNYCLAYDLKLTDPLRIDSIMAVGFGQQL
jgi:hypothetical protein